MTIKAMLVPNLNLSMLLSQYADTMIPMYKIMQTPLSCCGYLLYVKECLAIYYSLHVSCFPWGVHWMPMPVH